MLPTRRKLIAGNWKLNPTSKQSALDLAGQVKHGVSAGDSKAEIAMCAPFVYLDVLSQLLEGSHISLGAQDCATQDSGAMTGEVSASMLADLGVRYVVLGHSERRQHLSETSQQVAAKAMQAVDQGLVPLVCIGESKSQRDAGETDEVIDRELRDSLEGVRINAASELVLAYEPIWAIGTGDVCSEQEANRVCMLIRQVLADRFGSNVASAIRILYGGSVKAENVGSIVAQPEIDGALVGGASLKPDGFRELIANAQQS